MESRNYGNSLVILLMVQKSQTTTWDVFKSLLVNKVMGYLPYQLMNAGCLVTIYSSNTHAWNVPSRSGLFGRKPKTVSSDSQVVGGATFSHEPVNRRRETVTQGKESRNPFRWCFQADIFCTRWCFVFFFGRWVVELGLCWTMFFRDSNKNDSLEAKNRYTPWN